MNILFLTHRLPYAPNRGDRIRAYYLLREMSRFANVSLFSLVHDAEEAAQAPRTPFATRVEIARVHRARNLVRGAMSLGSSRPLTHTLLNAPGITRTLETLVTASPPDLVVAYCSGMARFAMAPPLDHLPFVLDMVDVDSAKWRDLASRGTGVRRWIYRREARTLAAFEASAVARARVTLVVNDRELSALTAIAPTGRIDVVENGIDIDAFRPGVTVQRSTTDVMFCGVMNYPPNEAGVLWFIESVWPTVRRQRPDARFRVVGASPTDRIQAAAAGDPSIEVTGAVPAVQPYLWRSAVSVAPLHLARGLQNKVLEALAAGLPTVVTPVVLEGLPDEARAGCLAADDAEGFASAVVMLLNSTVAERTAKAARTSLHNIDWPHRLRHLESLLGEAAAPDKASRREPPAVA